MGLVGVGHRKPRMLSGQPVGPARPDLPSPVPWQDWGHKPQCGGPQPILVLQSGAEGYPSEGPQVPRKRNESVFGCKTQSSAGPQSWQRWDKSLPGQRQAQGMRQAEDTGVLEPAPNSGNT